MNAPTLFDALPATRSTDPTTSRTAACSLAPVLRREQARVLVSLASLGDEGGTALQIRAAIEATWTIRYEAGSVRSRLAELERLGLVERPHKTAAHVGLRDDGSGRPQMVAYLTDDGWAGLDDARGRLWKEVEPIGKSGAARRRRRPRTIPPEVAAQVRSRSRGMCEVAHLIGCGPHPAQHLHHILMRSHGGEHTAENLLHVCEPGHRLIHGNPAVSYELGLLRRGVR